MNNAAFLKGKLEKKFYFFMFGFLGFSRHPFSKRHTKMNQKVSIHVNIRIVCHFSLSYTVVLYSLSYTVAFNVFLTI
jgi:hypothetical protein